VPAIQTAAESGARARRRNPPLPHVASPSSAIRDPMCRESVLAGGNVREQKNNSRRPPRRKGPRSRADRPKGRVAAALLELTVETDGSCIETPDRADLRSSELRSPRVDMTFLRSFHAPFFSPVGWACTERRLQRPPGPPSLYTRGADDNCILFAVSVGQRIQGHDRRDRKRAAHCWMGRRWGGRRRHGSECRTGPFGKVVVRGRAGVRGDRVSDARRLEPAQFRKGYGQHCDRSGPWRRRSHGPWLDPLANGAERTTCRGRADSARRNGQPCGSRRTILRPRAAPLRRAANLVGR
jgi:hypothetical protein